MARLAEQAERFDEMLGHMKAVACLDTELSVEERNVLSAAYKIAVSSRRSSWRTIVALKKREESKRRQHYVDKTAEYLENVEKELTEICNEMLTLLNQHILPNTNDVENEIFYKKLCGDYNRLVLMVGVNV